MEDRDGAVWLTRSRIHNGSGPLCRASKGEIKCYASADGIPAPYAGPLAMDGHGYIWMGSASTLSRWKPGSYEGYVPKGMEKAENLTGVNGIAVMPDDSLWVGTCPIKALRKWLEAANVKSGSVFRAVNRQHKVAATGLHRDSIAEILKTAATRAGINATNIAGHSLRAGMATQAALNGSSERAIAKTTRHRSRRVLRRYIRPGEMFREERVGKSGSLIKIGWSREIPSYQKSEFREIVTCLHALSSSPVFYSKAA